MNYQDLLENLKIKDRNEESMEQQSNTNDDDKNCGQRQEDSYSGEILQNKNRDMSSNENSYLASDEDDDIVQLRESIMKK